MGFQCCFRKCCPRLGSNPSRAIGRTTGTSLDLRSRTEFRIGGTSASDMDKVLKAIDQRLNAGPERLTQVRKLDDGRIEVALMRNNDKDQQRVERLLSKPGTLEFRILANERDNKELIEQARKEPSKAEVLDASGKRLAWWVPVKEARRRALPEAPILCGAPEKRTTARLWRFSSSPIRTT